ncbi:MAG: DUF2341 domain-containing protein, partial [Candidatus Thorarchaeota archaeon]
MRHKYVISLVLVVMFISPMLANNDVSTLDDNSNSWIPEGMSNFVNSADPYSGTGPSLPVSLSGIATDPFGGSLQIDSSTSDIHTITLDDGWTGSNLQTTIDSLSIDVDDVRNGDLNLYHNEKFLIAGETSYNYEDVAVPDFWTLTKSITGSGSEHPMHGTFEMNDVSESGYSGTMGWRFDADWSSSTTVNSNDQIYLSQLVSAPYREIYTVDITFNYYVSASSNLADQVVLFTRFNGYETEYHVVESGDTTGTWLPESFSLPAAQVSAISMPNSILLEIGLKSNVDGSQASAQVANVFIDNVQLDLNVRPFPEQIDLKVNGTAVIGATPGSIYPYVPDDSNRDASDDPTNGVDLDGYNDGNLNIAGWGSTGWTDINTWQSGFQFPLAIPQGAVITSAYLEVEPAGETAVVAMRIHASGQNSSSLPIENFATGLPNMEDRFNWVDTSIDWTMTHWIQTVRIRQKSPDISPLIQAVVSDSDWQSGNYTCIMLDYMWSSAYQSDWTIKGSSNYAQDELARLFVEYMIPLPEDTVYFMQYEKDITIQASQVTADLTDFPVLIDIVDSDLKTDVQADGDDIIFRLGDEALDFEIESFDQGYSPTHAHLTAWVKIPYLSSTSNTVITMAYGNPNAESSSSTAVWDDYETVHHLNDDPSGTVYDSTSNNYDGTAYGTMGSEDSVTGLVSGGIDFDGSGTQDMISIGQIYTDDWTEVTISIWIKSDVAKDARVFSKSPSTGVNEHIVTMRMDTSNHMTARIRTDLGGSSINGNITFTQGSWSLLTWSWSASSGYILGYINGTPVIEASRSGNNLYDSIDMFIIGNTDMTNDRYFDGVLDEARLANRLLSVDWITTEYNNQVDPSSFVSVGSERTLQSTWTDTESTSVRFSTTFLSPVDIFPIVTMDISAGGQTLDENMQDGTSFYVANDTVVEWTANVLVSPPADTDSLNVVVDYPLTEWKPTTLTNPIGQSKTFGTDWIFRDGSVIILSDAIDVWGVWTIEFVSWNYAYDFQLGPNGDSNYDTYSFNVGQTAEFNVSSPWIEDARVGLVLTDPEGSVWHTDYATSGTPGTTWDVPSFSNRMQLTVPAAQVDADVQNFPMLVSFIGTDFITGVQADGDDFVFVQSGAVLAHEIDRFEQSTGQLVAWVRANL